MARSFQITNLFRGLSIYESLRLAVQAGHPARFNAWRDVDGLADLNEQTTELIRFLGLEGIEQAGALGEGVYYSSSYFFDLPSPGNRRFVYAYLHKFPEAGPPNQPAAATYDAVYLLREVIARSGPRREAVRRALAGVGSATPAFEGVTGAVSFDAVGDVPNQNVYIGLVHRGRIQVENQAAAVAEAQ